VCILRYYSPYCFYPLSKGEFDPIPVSTVGYAGFECKACNEGDGLMFKATTDWPKCGKEEMVGRLPHVCGDHGLAEMRGQGDGREIASCLRRVELIFPVYIFPLYPFFCRIKKINNKSKLIFLENLYCTISQILKICYSYIQWHQIIISAIKSKLTVTPPQGLSDHNTGELCTDPYWNQ
jgi:hypothetical protein